MDTKEKYIPTIQDITTSIKKIAKNKAIPVDGIMDNIINNSNKSWQI